MDQADILDAVRSRITGLVPAVFIDLAPQNRPEIYAVLQVQDRPVECFGGEGLAVADVTVRIWSARATGPALSRQLAQACMAALRNAGTNDYIIQQVRRDGPALDGLTWLRTEIRVRVREL